MSDITVLGLGKMGAALARTLHDAGHVLTVWNRSPARMQPFIDDGVTGAAALQAAISASPVILICIDDYAATNTLFQAEHIRQSLAGRTLVQLSTGTPHQAVTLQQWAHDQGCRYLDGAILASPSSIGTSNAEILLCGDQNAHSQTQHLLSCLGDSVRYLGENIRAAAGLDLAWLTISYGRFVAITHAAILCRAEGIGMDEFVSLFTDDPTIQKYSAVIRDREFEKSTATLDIWDGALQRICQQADDANINAEFPDFVAGIFKRATAAGYGKQNVMSLVKVLDKEFI